MLKREELDTPGEHAFNFKGANGQVLEGIYLVPEEINTGFIAILGHPHSLQGGTMQNKVVTTLARTFKELSIPSVRFNFRGVGASEGSYDAGIGESEDMMHLAELLAKENPGVNFLFAGFSFGSYVAYRAASNWPNKLLLTVAPPVHHYDYQEFTPPEPWVIVQGNADEVVPAEYVYTFKEEMQLPLPILAFETGHFFHGKLVELKQRLLDVIRENVPL